MKKLSTLICRKDLIKGLATVSFMITVFWMTSFTVFAAKGTVKGSDVVIRKETSTESEKVGSVEQGKQIDILEAVKDSAGTVWYKVSLSGGGYGYIRSDLVDTSETIEISSNTSTASNSGSVSVPETVPTSIGEQPAVIKSGSANGVNVRSGASTQHATVTTLPNGTSVTLIGEANDSSGKKWYQITCSYNGRTIEGYVREDLLDKDVAGNGGEGNPEGAEGNESGEGNPEGTEGEYNEGAPEEGSEGAPAQQPAEQHNDYEVIVGSDGFYYLCDYNSGNQILIDGIFSILEKVSSPEDVDHLQSQVKNEKIIIIILAVVIVIMFIVLTILLFKIRDLYYDYEEDEEEEEEEEEPAPVKKRARKRTEEGAEEEERPVRSGKSRTREEKELYAAQQREPSKKPAARKPQNFLVDDDEFEFEFLNMDDKDL